MFASNRSYHNSQCPSKSKDPRKPLLRVLVFDTFYISILLISTLHTQEMMEEGVLFHNVVNKSIKNLQTIILFSISQNVLFSSKLEQFLKSLRLLNFISFSSKNWSIWIKFKHACFGITRRIRIRPHSPSPNHTKLCWCSKCFY